MKSFYTIIIFSFITISAFAQYQIGLVPRISPDKAVSETVGYTTIDIKYGSPSVRGRTIFGDLEPYDKVWRAGANTATTIEFNEAVEINGQPLAKGKYALFIIPKKNNKWTIIFSKKHKQWGAFRYDEADDALRVESLPMTNDFQENLTYSIEGQGFEYAHVFLEWENIKVGFDVKMNYIEVLKNKITTKLETAPEETKWVVYLQGAEFLYNQNEHLDLALEWLNKSENLYPKDGEWNKQYYPKHYILGHLYWTKAKVLFKTDSKKEALTYVQKMKDLQEPKYNFYLKHQSDIDGLMEAWESEE